MSDPTILYPVSNTSREEFLAERKKQKYFITGMRFFILIFILAGWEIAARYHIGITIGETLVSFVLVLIIGTLIAMLLWWCRSAADILEPYFVVLNSLPKTALAPILIVWLGNNMKTIIVCGVTMAVFSTIINLYTAFIHIDSDKLLLIRTLGGTRRDILRYIVLPASISAIVSNLKVNIGLCLVGVIIGEFLAANAGLGYLIIYGSQVFRLDYVMLSIIILCILAMVLYQLLSFVEKRYQKKQ